jgi:uncharacterized protein DUF5329
MNEATFVRNGKSYSAKTAETFLRRKWAANSSHVKNAQDFIDKIATRSGTLGSPYLISFKDGRQLQSAGNPDGGC